MTASIAALYRYPIKGLSPEAVMEAVLQAGQHFPLDRLFAIENGPSGFDPAAPQHMPKIKFLMLMRNERLAQFRSYYDEAARWLSIETPDGRTVVGDPYTEEGRAAFDALFSETFAGELRGPPRFLVAPDGYRFVDSRRGFVSLINLASVAAIEARAGKPVDPLRFRGNIHATGLQPWAEFDLVGKRFAIGGATFVGIARITRCAATEVDPTLGLRDIRMLSLLETSFGHNECGAYLRIESPGRIAPGDVIEVLGDAPPEPVAPTAPAPLPFSS
jgi:uncharacterized protein YcbX